MVGSKELLAPNVSNFMNLGIILNPKICTILHPAFQDKSATMQQFHRQILIKKKLDAIASIIK